MLKKGQKVRVTIDNSYFNKGQIVEVHKPDKYGAWLIGEDITGKHADWYFDYNNFKVVDPVVESIIDKFKQRSEVGIKKYGTTLYENNTDDFLNHLQEELMDAILYIQKLRYETEKTKK
jgi:hypothetical protein